MNQLYTHLYIFKQTNIFTFLLFTLLFFGTVNVNGVTKTWSGGNGTWNTASNWAPSGVPGAGDDVIINSTGIVTVNITSASCNNFTLNTGTFILNNNNTSNSFSITGDYNQTGGTFNFNAGTSGASNMYLGGNFTQTSTSGSMTTTGNTANGNIIFNKSGVQTINFKSESGSNYVKYIINPSSTLQILSNFNLVRSDTDKYKGEITVNGSIDFGIYKITSFILGTTGPAIFTLNSGATLLTANSGGIDGSISSSFLTRTFSLSANYTFNGTSAQITSAGMPTTVNNLTFSNSGSIVTLSNPTTTNSSLLITKGTLNTNSLNMTIGGNFTNNGALTANGSTLTFSGATKSLNGTSATIIPNVVVTGTYTNNTILTAGTSLTGNGTLTQGISSTLNITGTSTITNLTATANGNTVNYNGGAQTVHSNDYYNLSLTNTGIKNLQPGTNSILGNFSITDATTTAVKTLTIGGDVILNNAFNFTGGSFIHNVGGNWTRNGWNNYTPGTGTINFTGNNSTINGTQSTQTFNNIIIAKTAGQNLSIGGSLTILNIDGNLTLSSGAFSPGAIPTAVSGNWTNNGGSLTSGTGTITLKGAGKTIGGTSSTIFNNLTINASGMLLGIDQTVNGMLTLSNGILNLGAYNLTLGASSPAIVGGPWSWTGNMIVAVGTGELRKIFTENGSYVFPIGDATTISPITLNFTSGTFDTDAYAGVNVTKAKHAQINSPNYLNRYWSVSQSGIHSFICNVTGSYVYADLVGAENLQTTVEYTGSLPWLNYSALSAYTLKANGVSTFGIFTAMGLPSLSTDVSVRDGFTYIHYDGPSAPKSFTVAAQSLTNNVIVTAPTDFELSTSWGGPYSPALTLIPSNGIINTAIYVRLKAGLAVGDYSNETIVCSTTGLNQVNVQLTNATVTAPVFCTPTGDASGYSITLVNLGTLNNISAKPSGYTDYSTTQPTNLKVGNTYQLIVNVNTDGNKQVGAKAWIDWNNGGFTSNSGYISYDLGIATNQINGKTSSCPVTITVPAGASLGPIRMRVACNYWGANNPCDLNSEVEDYTLNIINPVITTSASTLAGFKYAAGNGPSNELPLTITGTGLADNILVTPPLNYEICILSGGIFQSTPLTLTKTGSNVNATIYVRLKAGLTAGTYGPDPQNITLTSTSAITKNITCTGIVTPGITAGGGGSYCSNQSITLTSSAVGYTNLYWEGPNSFYSLNNVSPIIAAPLTAAMKGDYKVTASFLIATNLLKNGNFESTGNLPVDFTSNYTPKTPSGDQTLWDPATYTVVANPKLVHANFSDCSDHTTGGSTPTGKQMVINGAGVADVVVWGQEVVVVPNANYQFTYWVQSVVSTSPSALQLYVNGIEAGPIYNADPGPCVWKQFLYNWNSGLSSKAILTLKNKNTDANGNDFALDDLVFQQVYTSSATVNVSVITVAIPASVSIAVSPGITVNTGTTVTFTATPTNGGTAPTYQWLKGGVEILGATGPVYAYVPYNGDVITCKMNSSSTCISGLNSLVTSNSISMVVVNNVVNYWNGTTNSNWSDASNWTAKVVPGDGENIVFSTVSKGGGNALRDLVVDVDKSIGSLTNETSPMQRLIIPPARFLTINGSISTGNDPDRIYIQAYPDGTQQNGSLIFHTSAPVYGTVEMYSRGHWNSAGVTYEGTKYYYSWQYFGIPVEPLKASPTFDGSYVRSWEESGKNISDHWVSLANMDELKPFYGYEITQKVPVGKTIIFKGQLLNRNWETPKLTNTFTIVGALINALFPGQHILANPYTAAIDIKKFLNRNSSAIFGIKGEIYLYSTGSFADWGFSNKGTSNGASSGQYQVASQTTGIDLPTQIPSMQAFLIQTITVPLIDSKVSFNYADVVKNNSLQRVKDADASVSNSVYTKIDVTGSNYSDKLWIFSDPAFTRNYDSGWDGTKMFGIALAPQLFALESDGSYQIDCVDDMNNTILGFQNGIDVEYTLTFTHENLDTRYAGIYLEDLVEKRTIDITASGTKYAFMSEPSATAVKRFKIITRTDGKEDANAQLKIFGTQGTIFVHNLSAVAGYALLYDMSGRFLQKLPFDPATVTAFPMNIIPGAYVIKAITKNEEVTKRLLISRNE